MDKLIELLPLYAELQGHPKLEIVKHYARACVAHATAAKDAEIEALRAKTAMTMGVGTGDGKLFVHGDYESIKAAQEIVLERDALRAEVERWKSASLAQSGYAHAGEKRAADAEARAERLAEALRHLRNHTSVNSHQIELIDSALNPTAAQEKDDA